MWQQQIYLFRLGWSEVNDNTAKLETKLQRRLLHLKKNGQLTPSVFNNIRPTDSQRPGMYGLPKIRKASVPLRSISPWLVHLNMSWRSGSAQYFSRSSIDTQPAVLMARSPLLNQFKNLLPTRIKLFFVHLISQTFSLTFHWWKLFKFVRTPYMEALDSYKHE